MRSFTRNSRAAPAIATWPTPSSGRTRCAPFSITNGPTGWSASETRSRSIWPFSMRSKRAETSARRSSCARIWTTRKRPRTARLRGARDQQHQDTAERKEATQSHQREREAAGVPSDPPCQGRAEEPAEVAHRVDQRQAGRRRRPGKHGRRESPEDRVRDPEAGRGNAQRGHGEVRIAGERRGTKSERAHEGRKRNVQAALAAAIGAAPGQNAAHRSAGIRKRRQQTRLQPGGPTERLNDLRQPESDAKERQQNAQLRERQKQRRTMKKYGGRAPRRRCPAFAPSLLRQGGGKPGA